MIRSAMPVSFFCCLALLAACVLAVAEEEYKLDLPTPVSGLAYGFYNSSCPKAEAIVKREMKKVLRANITEAAGLIRLFFHDCFVQGCDASLMINDTKGELFSIPNLTIRPSARAIIEQIKSALESACPNTVSCSDILTLAARESVHQAGGPRFPVPTGRRDGLTFASNLTVLGNIPAPFFNNSQLVQSFERKNLDVKDLTALSGTHTVGLAHCGAFAGDLFPNVSSRYNPSFAQALLRTCPSPSVNNVVNMDMVTPNRFDNQYFRNALSGSVDFDSDDALIRNSTTKKLVKKFASSQKKYFKQLSVSMIKMSMIEVLTGSAGNIRKVCSVFNSKSVITTETVDVGHGFEQ